MFLTGATIAVVMLNRAYCIGYGDGMVQSRVAGGSVSLRSTC
jgi:hypothetical protein